MAHVIGIMGSPSSASKSSALVRHALGAIAVAGASTAEIELRTLDTAALLHGDAKHPTIRAFVKMVERADGVVVGTPVYKAAYSGLLKAALDVLPQFGLAGKVVLPLGTGGSLAHVLALDYALRPVLQSMGARHVVQGQFVCDADVLGLAPFALAPAVQATLDEAVKNFSYSLTDDPAARSLGHPRPTLQR